MRLAGEEQDEREGRALGLLGDGFDDRHMLEFAHGRGNALVEERLSHVEVAGHSDLGINLQCLVE
jgi:hypothetical protein